MSSFITKIRVNIKSIFYAEHRWNGELSREDYWAHHVALLLVLGIPFLSIYLISYIIPHDISKWLYLLIIPIALKCMEANYAAQFKRYSNIKSPGNKSQFLALFLFSLGIIGLLLGLNEEYKFFGFLMLIFSMFAMFGLFLITYIKSFFVAGKK